MFGLIYMGGNSTTPTNVTDTFGKKAIPSHIENTTDTTDPNATLQNVTVIDDANYRLAQNLTAIETQGSGAGIIIVAACAVLVLVFAFNVMARGKYSKDRYRT